MSRLLILDFQPVYQMIGRLSCSEELLLTWHLKSSQKLNTVDLLLIFGQWESCFMPYCMEAFHIGERQIKNCILESVVENDFLVSIYQEKQKSYSIEYLHLNPISVRLLKIYIMSHGFPRH